MNEFKHSEAQKATESPEGTNTMREEDVLSLIEYSTKAIAPFLLPMIEGLGDMKIEESED
jgi:hypothetical protein